MQLPHRPLLLLAGVARLADAFAPPSLAPPVARAAAVGPLFAGTDVEALLAKVRALREAAQADEDALQGEMFQKNQAKADATDAIVDRLFPADGGDAATPALVARLREKRLASGTLVEVVERLHAREMAAKGLEHVESAVAGDQVTFARVAQEDAAELARVAGLVDRLIAAAEVLDREFLADKSNEKMTNSDMMHWGGGNTAGLLKDKARDLGREHSEQFRKRQQEFFDAAKRNPDLSAGDFHEYSWQESWKGVDESKRPDAKKKKKDEKDKKDKKK